MYVYIYILFLMYSIFEVTCLYNLWATLPGLTVYIYIYLLLSECEVRTASYGPSIFPSFYGPSAKRAGHENKEGKNEDP